MKKQIYKISRHLFSNHSNFFPLAVSIFFLIFLIQAYATVDATLAWEPPSWSNWFSPRTTTITSDPEPEPQEETTTTTTTEVRSRWSNWFSPRTTTITSDPEPEPQEETTTTTTTEVRSMWSNWFSPRTTTITPDPEPEPQEETKPQPELEETRELVFDTINEKIPILMVHGMGGSASNWTTMKGWLRNEGYADDMLFTINMSNNSTLCYSGHKEQIAQKVEEILAETGYERIDVIGHSRGALNLYDYIHFSGGTETVRNFVSVAGALFMCGGSYGSDLTPGDQVAYTSIYSPQDTLVGRRPIEGANNVELSNVNHITAITNQTVFTFVMDALEGDGLNDGQPVD